MIIETLTKRRNEIAQQIRKMNENLIHLDATIKLFAPEYSKPRMKHGSISRTLFDALRNAGKPISTRELSEATGIDMKRVGITLNAQAKKGLVKSFRGDDRCYVWEAITAHLHIV